jgi:dihydrofolate reductase
MSKIIAIAAVTNDGILAIDGKMPWNVPEDLRRFRILTVNNTVIMGRKTWESLGKKCLSNRKNIIVSANCSETFSLITGTTATVYTHIDYAINDSQLKYPDKDIYIIGGASIYSQTLPLCDELELTIIEESRVNREGKDILYLKEYPKTIDALFVLDSEFKTYYATYKKYKRRTSNKCDKNRTIYS